jgi:hypothetical protein
MPFGESWNFLTLMKFHFKLFPNTLIKNNNSFPLLFDILSDSLSFVVQK